MLHMQELLAGKKDEVQKLTTELEDQCQLAKDTMKQARERNDIWIDLQNGYKMFFF